MTTVNLTTEQLEAITEAFAKGESVTLQPPIKQWEPKGGLVEGLLTPISRTSAKLCENAVKEIATFKRLLAYRDEFDPNYKIESNSFNYYIYFSKNTESYAAGDDSSNTTDVAKVYMSEQVAKDLAAKLNSGEVVL